MSRNCERLFEQIRTFVSQDHPSLEELDDFVENGQRNPTDSARLACLPLHLRLCGSCAEYVNEAASGFPTIADLVQQFDSQ
jgi:hypothetical protein